MKKKSFFFLLLLQSLNVNSQSSTIVYTYDPLGRLTFVEDSVNGNRDYDYDKAGNRLIVAVGESSDQMVEPGVPPAPTGLLALHVADCAWRGQWNAVPDATRYVFRETLGTETTVTTLYAGVVCTRGNKNSNRPYWVRACNLVGCGDKAYF